MRANLLRIQDSSIDAWVCREDQGDGPWRVMPDALETVTGAYRWIVVDRYFDPVFSFALQSQAIALVERLNAAYPCIEEGHS